MASARITAARTTAARRPSTRNAVNLAVDLGIFIAFLVAMAPRFSGIAVHEWLSIAFGAAIVTHLLLHWKWIVEITRKLFTKANWTARTNYILNSVLFVAMVVAIFSGIMISEAALPLFGIQTQRGGIWRGLHGFSADLSMVILGLHIALHWQWILNMTKRFVVKPLFERGGRRQSAVDTAPSEVTQ